MVTNTRTIPLVWRWIGVLFGSILFLTGGMVIIGHAQPADPNRCLIFSDSLQNSAAIDLYTGATMGFNRHYPQEAVQSVYQSQLSPDGLHLAYSRFDLQSSRVQLYVKATSHIGVESSVFVQPRIGPVDFAPYNPASKFVWSPDGQWLAYWWQMPNGEAFLGVSDPQGRIVSTKSFWPTSPPAAQSSVFFHGWSADSRYLALSVLAANSRQYTLSLWAGPILARVREVNYTRLKDEAITPLSDPNQLALWSTHGHQITYLAATADLQQIQISVAAPEHDPIITELPTIPKVPLNNGELPTFNWSPDDRHLALIRISPVRHWLEVIDPVAQTVQTVTDQAMAMETIDFQMYTHWAAGSQTLFYAKMAASTTNPGNLDIMALHLADHQSETLIADVYDNAIATSDRRYLLYKQSTWQVDHETIDTMVLNLGMGRVIRIPNMDQYLATDPLYIIGEAPNDWVAISDEFAHSGSSFPALDLLSIKIFNANTGIYYALADKLLTTDLSHVLNNAHLQFLAPNIGLFASIPDNSNQLIFTKTGDGSQRAVLIFNQPTLFKGLLWSPNSQQVATLSAGQFFSMSQQFALSLALIDVANGLVRRIEPLPNRYSYLNYAACR